MTRNFSMSINQLMSLVLTIIDYKCIRKYRTCRKSTCQWLNTLCELLYRFYVFREVFMKKLSN